MIRLGDVRAEIIFLSEGLRGPNFMVTPLDGGYVRKSTYKTP
jgi:hypothetical protein